MPPIRAPQPPLSSEWRLSFCCAVLSSSVHDVPGYPANFINAVLREGPLLQVGTVQKTFNFWWRIKQKSLTSEKSQLPVPLFLQQ